jgi:hypothetical protein
MNKFTKEDLYKLNKKAEFPEKLIENDSLNYKDILYQDTFDNTIKKNSLSNSYYIDDSNQMKPTKRQWRDNTVKPKQFVNKYDILNTHSFSIKYENSLTFNPTVVSEIETKRSHLPFNINALYLINEKLRIGKSEPLWYLNNLGNKSLYGPISSKEVEGMYMDKKFDGSQEIRLIDIFKQKNKPNYTFFKLKELEQPNFIKEIDGNLMVKYIDELEKVKSEIIKQETVKKETYSTQSKTRLQPEEVLYTTKQVNKQKKQEPVRPKVEVPINTGPSVIDMDFKEESKEFKTQNKKDKKKKGKLVDLDIKTGFFTITEQEKKYEPIYICGDLDKK